MDNCKLVHENVYDFKLKPQQIVNDAAFNNIFQKLVDNDESLMRVRDMYCYGPKTLRMVDDFRAYECISSVTETDPTTHEERQVSGYVYINGSGEAVFTKNYDDLPLNPKRIRYKTKGYKVWQNINYTPTTDRLLPGSRTSDYDVLQLNDISGFIEDYSGTDSYKDYQKYWDAITTTPSGLSTDAWTSTFENQNTNNVVSTTNQTLLSAFNKHIRDFHKSYVMNKEQNLHSHAPVIQKMDNTAIVISADLPSNIRKITSSSYISLEVKNPYTFTHCRGHNGDVSDDYKDVGVVPTATMIEYASGMKYFYINVPSTKTYWLPFVAPSQLKYQDKYVNFYNLPFDPKLYSSEMKDRNYFGLGQDDSVLYGCDEAGHPRKRYVDVSDPAFVTDFRITIRNFDVQKVFNAVISNESPALNRIQFGYSENPIGIFQKQHGGDNSYYPPSMMVEDPVVGEDGSITLHCCCFGSDSQNIMVICH